MSERLNMKYSVLQLDRIILALLDNSFNRKFVSNVNRLFNSFYASSVKSDFNKETRVYLIKQICDIIIDNKINGRENILSYIITDGKYAESSKEVLSVIVEEETIDENEVAILDKSISYQLKYSYIENRADNIIGMLNTLKAETYEDLNDQIQKIELAVEGMNRELKSSRESIEDAKKDLSLSSSGFIGVLGNIIQKERNPSARVKTGLQFMNNMLNGGFERQRVYCALGVAKGWKSRVLIKCNVLGKTL